jgi:hypothetical protein
MTPTGDQLTGALRTILAAAGGYAVARGWIDAGTATTLAGGIAILITAIWSWVSHTRSAMIHSVNSADNGVSVVSTLQAIASGVPTVDKPLK